MASAVWARAIHIATEVYLKAYDAASEARASIGHYLDFYNRRRPHSSPLRLAA